MRQANNRNAQTLSVPNTVIEGDGFYISFNDTDTAIYGDVTTALVKGQMEQFFILMGDHREQYQPLIAQGFDACLAYFNANSQQASGRAL